MVSVRHELENNVNENSLRRVIAHYDDETVIVYQAFRPEIVHYAVQHGTFGKGFGMDRMTWIKPSFGWMLHRSEYATAHNQEAIARIRMTRAGFDAVLTEAVLTYYVASLHGTETAWGDALRRAEVQCQWDPDRNLRDGRLERRAIQLGLRRSFVPRYVNEWIVDVEDVTELAHEIREVARAKGSAFPAVPEERHYPVSDLIRQRLGCE